MDSFGLIDTDALIWTERDVRAGLIRVASDPQYFPNAHVAELQKLSGAHDREWRGALKFLAENFLGALIENRSARIVVGMQAEDNSGPEKSKVNTDAAILVDDSYIP